MLPFIFFPKMIFIILKVLGHAVWFSNILKYSLQGKLSSWVPVYP